MSRSVPPAPFLQVTDSRQRPIPGLFVRGNRYYARLRVVERGKATQRRIPLLLEDGKTPVANTAEARAAMDLQKHLARSGVIRAPRGKAPLFSAWLEIYLASDVRKTKYADSTASGQEKTLRRLAVYFGALPLDEINARAAAPFIESRIAGKSRDAKGRVRPPASAATINLDLSALRVCLEAAKDAGHLEAVPVIDDLDGKRAKPRRLISTAEVSAFLDTAVTLDPRWAAPFAFYVRFLAASGCREQEALRMKWESVDSRNGQIIIGADGKTKSGRARRVDQSSALSALLAEMKADAGADGSVYLFPHPRRRNGDPDRPAKSFRECLKECRRKMGWPWLAFHHFRHYFASHCIMSGIDAMTTAAWLGHNDGGILVSKVYGHLNDSHKRQMSQRLTFS